MNVFNLLHSEKAREILIILQERKQISYSNIGEVCGLNKHGHTAYFIKKFKNTNLIRNVDGLYSLTFLGQVVADFVKSVDGLTISNYPKCVKPEKHIEEYEH